MQKICNDAEPFTHAGWRAHTRRSSLHTCSHSTRLSLQLLGTRQSPVPQQHAVEIRAWSHPSARQHRPGLILSRTGQL